MSDDLIVIGTGIAAAVACAIPGCFLVLRGISLVGDAISH
ncbi:MAG: metal ABC transporter permease, partial [Planctomycetota bacterium]